MHIIYLSFNAHILNTWDIDVGKIISENQCVQTHARGQTPGGKKEKDLHSHSEAQGQQDLC